MCTASAVSSGIFPESTIGTSLSVQNSRAGRMAITLLTQAVIAAAESDFFKRVKILF